MARMQTAKPARKVVFGTTAVAITTIIIWLMNATGLLVEPVPANIAGALTTVITFIAGYMVPPVDVACFCAHCVDTHLLTAIIFSGEVSVDLRVA